MGHPVQKLDLARCDFFVFGHLKENLAGQPCDSDEEPFPGVQATLAAISGG
jgi:hypothetical protein